MAIKARIKKLTKKEVIRRFNRLIAKGKIFDDEKLSEIMEAYKVDKVGKIAMIYKYNCCICGREVSEDDFFVSCRMKGTLYARKTIKPVHKKCIAAKEANEEYKN